MSIGPPTRLDPRSVLLGEAAAQNDARPVTVNQLLHTIQERLHDIELSRGETRVLLQEAREILAEREERAKFFKNHLPTSVPPIVSAPAVASAPSNRSFWTKLTDTANGIANKKWTYGLILLSTVLVAAAILYRYRENFPIKK